MIYLPKYFRELKISMHSRRILVIMALMKHPGGMTRYQLKTATEIRYRSMEKILQSLMEVEVIQRVQVSTNNSHYMMADTPQAEYVRSVVDMMMRGEVGTCRCNLCTAIYYDCPQDRAFDDSKCHPEVPA